MRKYPLLLLIVLLALAIGAVACDSDDTAARAQLQTAWSGGKDVTSRSGSYELTLTAAGDASKVPAGSQGIAQALLGKPIVLTGDFAISGDPLGADVSASTSVMGITLEVGALTSGGKAYLHIIDQWYEAPDKTKGLLAQDEQTAGLLDTIRQAIATAGLDPTTWCTNIRVTGEETLADTQVVHLTSRLDVKKMLADVTTLMQGEQLARLAASTGSTDQSAAGAPEIHSAAELEGKLGDVEGMLKNATVDFWLAKSDSTVRKMELSTELVVPGRSAGSGITGANVVATLEPGQPGQTVSIKAPTSAKPFADLKQDLKQDLKTNPIFAMILGFLSGGSFGDDSGTTTTLGR
jgi:hypothetical protein